MPHTGTHSNELPARSFAPLVDVDPPLVDSVLEMMASENIAAYAEPYSGETGPYRDVRAPDRPTSRVFVDRERFHVARAVISSRLPQLQAALHADAAARADAEHMAKLSAAQVDAAWSDLLTTLTETDSADTPPSPKQGSGLSSRLIRQHDDSHEESDDEHDGLDFTDDRQARDDAMATAGGPRDYAVADDLDEKFSPPEPPPLPRPRDAIDRFAWGGAIGGPMVVVVSYVFGLGTTWGGVGFAAFAAGFITLVARMKTERDSDDDGAVV